MSKVKKVLRTIIAEEVAKEVRQLIKENQEVGPVDQLIDQKFTEDEVNLFRPYISTMPNLVKFLTKLIYHIKEVHKIKGEDISTALRLVRKVLKDEKKQDVGKLKGDEAAKEAMNRG